MKKYIMGLTMLGILIAAGCQTKVETFSSYMSDMENDVNRIVKDSARADQVIAVVIEVEHFFTRVKPDYQALMLKKKQLDYAHVHNAEGYRLLYEELDNLNDGIRKELFSYSKEMRFHLEEKEWKKLTDSSFLNTFLYYLEEGV